MDSQITKPNVLLVDDSPVSMKALGEILSSDYNITYATSGEKCLELAFSDNSQDLILLDIIMPGMDGYEVCKKLKEDSRTKNTPIIFLTVKSEQDDIIRGFESGAVDYVSKPFNPVIVKARVKTHVDLKMFRDTLEKLSSIDYLTGISNRRSFDEFYSVTWGHAARNSETVSAIMADVDFFKMYNDTFGHTSGDECLIKIAQAISTSVKRKIDIVARYGGEEFICLLPKANHYDALHIADKMREKVLSLKISNPSSPTGFATISLGVATILADRNKNPQDLIMEADMALYKSKMKGRNTVEGINILNE